MFSVIHRDIFCNCIDHTDRVHPIKHGLDRVKNVCECVCVCVAFQQQKKKHSVLYSCLFAGGNEL